MNIVRFLSRHKSMRWRFSSLYLYMFLIAMPLGIERTPSDSSGTNVYISFGGGNYASIVRGCEDYEPRAKRQFTFADVGLQVDHPITSHLRLGIRGSYIFDQPTDVTVINPFVRLEWRYLALGAGYVYSDHGIAWAASYGSIPVDRLKPDASFYLRIGDMSKLYFSTSLYNSIPLYSKGYFQFGFGGVPYRHFNLWAGMGSGPYADVIGIVAVGYDINKHLTFKVSAGLGEVEGVGQNSLNVGLKLKIPK